VITTPGKASATPTTTSASTPQATDCYQHALDLVRDLGDRYYEAAILTNLGDSQHAR
jgi:hypothetical protein